MMEKLNYFILTYGKADNIPTLNLLHSYGIAENIYLVVGEDDPDLEKYKTITDCNVLLFNKINIKDCVDSLGFYAKTLKLCTYARQAVDDFAKENDLRYICLMFDDILSVELRYVEDDKVRSLKEFDLEKLFNYYTDLLNCSDSVYYVGPPGSSFYIGINQRLKNNPNEIPTHYANILIYDITKPIGPYKASVMEDMWIVLANSQIGHIGLYPFGFQVNCRPSMVTEDAYYGINKSEWVQQVAILTGKTISYDKPQIPYAKFIPKIINEKYKKGI